MASVLVTGSAGGIGNACIEALSAAGHEVHGADIRPTEGSERQIDVRDEIAFSRERARIGASALVACAALMPHDDIDSILQTNYAACVENARCFISEAPSGAAVVLISSIAAFRHPLPIHPAEMEAHTPRTLVQHLLQNHRPSNGYEAYCLSKCLLLATLRPLAKVALERGIRVNCIVLGPTESPAAEAMRKQDLDRWVTLRREIPFGAPIPIAEVTNLVSMLIAPSMRHLTGSTIYLDGGWCAKQLTECTSCDD